MSPLSPQERITALLKETGIPSKCIQVYGSQIVITAWSLNAANQWATVIAKIATLRRVMESTDDNVVNMNTVMLPSFHKVWRVYGVIK